VGPRTGLDAVEKTGKKSLPLSGIESQVVRPVGQSLIPTSRVEILLYGN